MTIARILKDATRPTRRWLASKLFPSTRTDGEWQHEAAQIFERDSNIAWLRDHGRTFLPLINSASREAPNETMFREFFNNDPALWREFSDHISGRSILDVGCGPIPAISMMPWAGRRIAIDPLIDSYDRAFKALFQDRSPFDGLERYCQKAEIFLHELSSNIDGAIICRNALDHLEFPAIVLSNLASYARPGCRLLLWTDVVHPNGGDRGHHSIAFDADSFGRLVSNLGFSVVRLTPESANRATIAWGCIAVRR